jgi:futalosine hydrolase
MDMILVTATALEMRRAIGELGGQAQVPERGQVPARLAGRDVLLLVTGVGPVNAALGLGRLLGQGLEANGILNLGLAGSFDLRQAPLGTPVTASQEIWPEYGLADEHGLAQPRAVGFPQLVDSGGEVWDRMDLDPEAAAQAMGLILDPAWAKGPSLTVAGVTGTLGRAEALRTRYKAVSENMEGFSLALACRERQLPFLEIRTVSNPVGERDRSKWDMGQALRGLGKTLAELLGRG